MSVGVNETVSVAEEPVRKEPQLGTEVHAHQYIELQHPEGVYYKARVADHAVCVGTQRNRDSSEPQHMEMNQLEAIGDTVRVAEHEVRCHIDVNFY